MKLPVVRKHTPMVFSESKALLSTEDRNQVVDFTKDLEDALRELESSVDRSKALNEQAGALKVTLGKRRWWGALGASVSGTTSKELATLVQGLGASLGVTQNVVRVLLRVMTQKNRVLYAFNETLVNKIALLQTDASTLDGNQKLVVKSFLTELQQQVSDQIEHRKRVDSHELQLIDHDQWRKEKDEMDQEVGDYLEFLEGEKDRGFSQIAVLETSSGELRMDVSSLQTLHAVVEQRTVALSGRLDEQQRLLREADSAALATARRVEELEAQVATLAAESNALVQRAASAESGLEQADSRIAALQASESEMSTRLVALEGRIEALERSERLSRSPKVRLFNAAPAAGAALLGAAALYFTVMA